MGIMPSHAGVVNPAKARLPRDKKRTFGLEGLTLSVGIRKMEVFTMG
jgi:hypothetical protein